MADNWIQNAIKHKGALTKRAKKNKATTREQAMKDAKSKNPKIKKQGILALTLMRIAKKRKEK